MTIKVGDKMPAGTFKTMTKDGPQNLTTDQLFAGKTVVLFSVPGAFTPTCDAKHLPGFVEKAGEFKAKGVDTIACMAVNDVFVMNAWGKHSNVGDGVLMLADGNARLRQGARPRTQRQRASAWVSAASASPSSRRTARSPACSSKARASSRSRAPTTCWASCKPLDPATLTAAACFQARRSRIGDCP